MMSLDTAERDIAIARRAIPLLDLTDLSDACSQASVITLCATAREAGVAAVCVWPAFVAQARRALDGSPVRVATVVNFPHGGEDIAATVIETRAAIAEGAHEVDLVLPYRALMRGDAGIARDMVAAIRDACGETLLKVILETGTLTERDRIEQASRLALEASADFLKTSTGKSPISATPEAVETMLAVLRDTGSQAGLKVSGGLKTVADAAQYLALADAAMGSHWARPATFRFGASSLYGELAKVVERER